MRARFNTHKQGEIFNLRMNQTEYVKCGTAWLDEECWVIEYEIEVPDTDNSEDMAMHINSIENYIEGVKDGILDFGSDACL